MGISTLSLNKSNLASMNRIQSDLVKATKESATGRYADVGMTLGRLTGTAVSYRVAQASVEAQQETNKVVDTRLTFAQNAMKSIADGTDTLSKALLATTSSGSDLAGLAISGLQQMQGALNAPLNGLYVFSGQKADTAPMKDSAAGIAAAKTAYTTYLGSIGKTSATVTGDEMRTFLTGDFMDTVNDANWAANWSNASSTEMDASISKSETVQTSVSANNKAFRDMTAGYSMLAAIAGETGLNADARKALSEEAYKRIGTGTGGITALRATVGTRQARVDSADAALTLQKDIMKSGYSNLENVDEEETALRVTQLTTQLQVSYKVTGQLQGLSILDYL